MESPQKDALREKIDSLLHKGLEKKTFTGASLAVSVSKKGRGFGEFLCGCGTTEGQIQQYAITTNTYFDLASLTKPLATVLSLMRLIDTQCLDLQTPLCEILEKKRLDSDKRQIKLWQLMAHCAGFAAHQPFYRELLGIAEEKRSRKVVDLILESPLQYAPGKKHIYSDLGYILLADIIERISGERADYYYSKEILEPLKLNPHIIYAPPKELLDISNCAVTGTCSWSNRQLCGEVHDDNCRALGGVAGHAGLFGTAHGVARLCSFLSRSWSGDVEQPLFSAELTQKVMSRVGSSTWSCGFDMPSRLYSSSGKYFSPTSIGHLGFTGTSFWIDLEKDISVVLLTNRVYTSAGNEQIKRLRPRFHNLVMEHILGG